MSVSGQSHIPVRQTAAEKPSSTPRGRAKVALEESPQGQMDLVLALKPKKALSPIDQLRAFFAREDVASVITGNSERVASGRGGHRTKSAKDLTDVVTSIQDRLTNGPIHLRDIPKIVDDLKKHFALGLQDLDSIEASAVRLLTASNKIEEFLRIEGVANTIAAKKAQAAAPKKSKDRRYAKAFMIGIDSIQESLAEGIQSLKDVQEILDILGKRFSRRFNDELDSLKHHIATIFQPAPQAAADFDPNASVRFTPEQKQLLQQAAQRGEQTLDDAKATLSFRPETPLGGPETPGEASGSDGNGSAALQRSIRSKYSVESYEGGSDGDFDSDLDGVASPSDVESSDGDDAGSVGSPGLGTLAAATVEEEKTAEGEGNALPVQISIHHQLQDTDAMNEIVLRLIIDAHPGVQSINLTRQEFDGFMQQAQRLTTTTTDRVGDDSRFYATIGGASQQITDPTLVAACRKKYGNQQGMALTDEQYEAIVAEAENPKPAVAQSGDDVVELSRPRRKANISSNKLVALDIASEGEETRKYVSFNTMPPIAQAAVQALEDFILNMSPDENQLVQAAFGTKTVASDQASGDIIREKILKPILEDIYSPNPKFGKKSAFEKELNFVQDEVRDLDQAYDITASKFVLQSVFGKIGKLGIDQEYSAQKKTVIAKHVKVVRSAKAELKVKREPGQEALVNELLGKDADTDLDATPDSVDQKILKDIKAFAELPQVASLDLSSDDFTKKALADTAKRALLTLRITVLQHLRHSNGDISGSRKNAYNRILRYINQNLEAIQNMDIPALQRFLGDHKKKKNICGVQTQLARFLRICDDSVLNTDKPAKKLANKLFAETTERLINDSGRFVTKEFDLPGRFKSITFPANQALVDRESNYVFDDGTKAKFSNPVIARRDHNLIGCKSNQTLSKAADQAGNNQVATLKVEGQGKPAFSIIRHAVLDFKAKELPFKKVGDLGVLRDEMKATAFDGQRLKPGRGFDQVTDFFEKSDSTLDEMLNNDLYLATACKVLVKKQGKKASIQARRLVHLARRGTKLLPGDKKYLQKWFTKNLASYLKAKDLVRTALLDKLQTVTRPELDNDLADNSISLAMSSISLISYAGDEAKMSDQQRLAWEMVRNMSPAERKGLLAEVRVNDEPLETRLHEVDINLRVLDFQWGTNPIRGAGDAAQLHGNKRSRADLIDFANGYADGLTTRDANYPKVAAIRELTSAIQHTSDAFYTADSNPFKLPVLVAALTHLISGKPLVNCFSGKDRTGVMVVLANILVRELAKSQSDPNYTIQDAVHYFDRIQRGELRLTEEEKEKKEENDKYLKIGLPITEENTGSRGYKSIIPFLKKVFSSDALRRSKGAGKYKGK